MAKMFTVQKSSNSYGLKEIYKKQMRDHEVNNAINKHGKLLITSYGRPMFVAISIEEYEKIVKTGKSK